MGQPKKRATHEIELYLSGQRDMALVCLAEKHHGVNVDVLVNILRQELIEYLKSDIPNFQGRIKCTDKPPKLIHDFDANKYFDTDFRHIPFIIERSEFDEIQGCIKNPIYLSRYDYNSHLYDFENQRTHDYYKLKDRYDRVREDTKFYLSENEDVIFSRDVVLKFKPKRYYFCKQIPKEEFAALKNDDPLFYDNYLYERKLSINMNVLLEGNPNRPLNFIRYDNDGYVHTNVWFGSSAKRRTFGESAESPHFHFQSRQDLVLCIKRIKTDENTQIYYSGRSNAISCRRLASYLKGLDVGNIKITLDSQTTRDMPFARFMHQGKKLYIDVDKIVDSYAQEEGEEGLSAARDWLSRAKDDPDYKPTNFLDQEKLFNEVVKALDFLTFITSRQKVATDVKEAIALSNLEIVIANKIMDCITLTNENYLTNASDSPKYTISYDFDEDKEKQQ